MFYVYMLLMKNNEIYTGFTSNILRRLKQHHTGNGGRTTKINGVQYLVHLETFFKKIKATKREVEIKGFNRKKKIPTDLFYY